MESRQHHPEIRDVEFLPHQETDSIYSWFHSGSDIHHSEKTLADRRVQNLSTITTAASRSSPTPVPSGHRQIISPSGWPSRGRFALLRVWITDLQLTDFLGQAPGGPPLYLRVLGSTKFESEQFLGTEVGYRTLVGQEAIRGRGVFPQRLQRSLRIRPRFNTYRDTSSTAPTRVVVQLPLTNATKGDTDGIEIAPGLEAFRLVGT